MLPLYGGNASNVILHNHNKLPLASSNLQQEGAFKDSSCSTEEPFLEDEAAKFFCCLG